MNILETYLQPPTSDKWHVILHWMLRVIPPDDSRVPFLASLLTHCHRSEGLTEKQAAAANKIYVKLLGDYECFALEYQKYEDRSATALANMDPAGSA